MKAKITQESRYTIDIGSVKVVECERKNGPAPGLAVYVGRLDAGRRPKVWLVTLEGGSLLALAPILGMEGEATLIAATPPVLDWIEGPKLKPEDFGMPPEVSDEFVAVVKSGLKAGMPLDEIKADLQRLAEDPIACPDHREPPQRLARRLVEIRAGSAPDKLSDRELVDLGVPPLAFADARALATHLADGGHDREGVETRLRSVAKYPAEWKRQEVLSAFERKLARKILEIRGDS